MFLEVMGVTHTKEISDFNPMLLEKNNNNAKHQNKNLTTENTSSTVYHEWQEICRCSHSDWLSEFSGKIHCERRFAF